MDQLEYHLRQVMSEEGCNIWNLIDSAINVASRDHHDDFLLRRDSIVQALYGFSPCRNCEPNRVNGYLSIPNRVPIEDVSDATPVVTNPVRRIEASPEMRSETPQPEDEDSPEMVSREIHQEQNVKEPDSSQISKIMAIKDYLGDPDEYDEESLVGFLQDLAAMDVTYGELKETDIGRQVNSLRKYPSSEVRRLVKQTVRKWKELVDGWVKTKSACDSSSPAILMDGDSPLPMPMKSHNEIVHSPRHPYGADLLETKPKPVTIRLSSSDRSGSDPSERHPKPAPTRPALSNGFDSVERRAKPDPVRVKSDPRNEAPVRANNRPSSSGPPAKTSEREQMYDSARLASARKRLQENYQEANNAKKQRTVQVMDLHEIPKPKNSFIRKNGPTLKHK